MNKKHQKTFHTNEHTNATVVIATVVDVVSTYPPANGTHPPPTERVPPLCRQHYLLFSFITLQAFYLSLSRLFFLLSLSLSLFLFAAHKETALLC